MAHATAPYIDSLSDRDLLTLVAFFDTMTEVVIKIVHIVLIIAITRIKRLITRTATALKADQTGEQKRCEGQFFS
mgnify:CR=1 FL=1